MVFRHTVNSTATRELCVVQQDRLARDGVSQQLMGSTAASVFLKRMHTHPGREVGTAQRLNARHGVSDVVLGVEDAKPSHFESVSVARRHTTDAVWIYATQHR